MPNPFSMRLARVGEAAAISVLSRDLVETGLGWSWRPPRVASAIRSPDNVVVVAAGARRIAGAAIMFFGVDEARLNLLVVRAGCQRAGVGRALVEWLEASALVAGTAAIYLEVRECRPPARAFYERLGYRAVQRVPGYYNGVETAIRMARDLWAPESVSPPR